MRKRVTEVINCKKGALSIMMVVYAFVMLIFIAGAVDLISKIYVINEVQGILDTAGVSALSSGLHNDESQRRWRNEEFVIDESLILSNFYEMVDRNIKPGQILKSFDYKNSTNLDRRSQSFLGIDSDRKSREQIYLISTARIKYRTMPLIDRIAAASFKYINFLSGDSESTISYAGSTGDGFSEIVVRSVSRMVYR